MREQASQLQPKDSLKPYIFPRFRLHDLCYLTKYLTYPQRPSTYPILLEPHGYYLPTNLPKHSFKMPVICGIHIHRNSHRHCRKSVVQEEVQVSPWTPARPPREDGPFGLPPPALPPYPPARSPLRHRSERSAAVRAQPIPVSCSGEDEHTTLGNCASHGFVSRFNTSHVCRAYHHPAENCVASSSSSRDGVYPRYGPNSRPPAALSRYGEGTTRKPRKKRRNESFGSPSTLPLNKPLPKTPQVQLAPVVPEWQKSPRQYLAGDEPIYFVPISFGQ